MNIYKHNTHKNERDNYFNHSTLLYLKLKQTRVPMLVCRKYVDFVLPFEARKVIRRCPSLLIGAPILSSSW